jgi:hypothetical protein
MRILCDLVRDGLPQQLADLKLRIVGPVAVWTQASNVDIRLHVKYATILFNDQTEKVENYPHLGYYEFNVTA